MAIARPEDINAAICEALGIDPTITKSLTIRLAAQEAARVEVVQFVANGEGGKLAEVLKRYTLTESEHGNTVDR
jgi:hypothetical protein